MNVSGDEPKERLLLALAEQLKLPLLQIARRAELAKDAETITTADMALNLIDSYILSVTPTAQAELQLEPLSAAAVLQDVAHNLGQYAKQYDCQLELNISGRYSPIMANRQSLIAAYTLLGYSFIEAESSQVNRPGQVILAAHKSAKGLVTGVFSRQSLTTSDMLRRAKALYGTARQPLTTLSASAGAGIFVADSLLQSMATVLHPAHHHKLNGLAATLLPSQQLHFNVR